MAVFRDLAIVLRQLDFSETSQILAFFTREHGKIRAIGKGLKRGTKKRFAVGIDILDLGDLTLSCRSDRGGLAILTDWKQTRSLVGLRDRLSRLYAAEYLAEVTDALTVEWDRHPDAFDALLRDLTELAETEAPLVQVVAFQAALLEAIGLFPRFEACVACDRKAELTHFSSREGGMLCRHCEVPFTEKRRVSSATLSELQNLDLAGTRTGPFALLNYHISYAIGREPRLARKLLKPIQPLAAS